MKTKEFYLFLLILLTSVTFTFAQSSKKKDKKKIELYGYVIDAKTKAGPDSVFVTLMREDSTVVDTMTCQHYEKDRWNMRDQTSYGLMVPADSATGKYIISAKAPGYYPNTLNYEIKKVARNRWFELPAIYLRPQKVGVPDSVMLDEVVVKATKIKMVQKGDTIIYDASAFPLEEGSMLEALVRQLPGAKLSSEGEITVNGEKVEELTLNGKDFFKGNKKVMLENLPSFTVKNIQVYHKSSEKSKWSGREEESKTFTMDVQLKRQYNKGFLGNVEVAAGTEDRYMGRLFALRYTDCSRLSVYANTNNVNENRKPGREGDWEPSNQPEGSRTTRKAGIDLQISEKERKWEETGNLEFSWDKSVDETTQNSEQFLSPKNTFTRSMSDRISRSKSVKLDNTFFFNRPTVWSYSYTQARYSENNSDYTSRSMLGDENYDAWGSVQASLDSAFSSSLNPQLQSQLINRRKDSSLTNYKSFYVNHQTNATLKLSSGDYFEFAAYGYYNDSKNKSYSLQDVNYFRIQDSDLYQNKHTTSPNSNYNYRIRGGYQYNASEHFSMELDLVYNQSFSNEEQNYYDLHNIDGWGMGSIHPLGTLPSNYDMEVLAIDANNSYRSTNMKKGVGADLTISYQLNNDSVNFYTYLSIPATRVNERYSYHSNIDAYRSRNYIEFSPSSYIYYRLPKKNIGINVNWNISQSQPSFRNMIDVTNDSDPLNIRLGNPDLKPSWNENLYFNANKRWQHGGDTITVYTNLNCSLNATQNAVSQGFTMDPSTGGRTYKPVNVNGNWNIGTNWGMGMDFGKEKKFNLNNSLGYNYAKSVDMLAVAGQGDSGLNTVFNNNWDDQLSLTYRSGDSLSLGVSGKVEYRHSTSETSTFSNVDAYNFSYGFNGTWRIFRTGFTLATDIKMFSRRGYASEELNTNNLVWNASVSRAFFKKKLIARLEMFDLLHQLTNTRININAQGRYETITNTLPRYAMLHLQWNFNTMGKVKGK